jgi:hypothetical protein
VPNGYEVWSDPLGGSAFTETADVHTFTPAGTLIDALTQTDEEILLDPDSGIFGVGSTSPAGFAAGANLLLVDDEWIAFQTVTENDDGSVTLTTIARGVMDTTPTVHGAGARIFFPTSGSGFTAAEPYESDLTVAAKLRPYNAAGMMPLEIAERMTVVLASRALTPYVPTAVLVNGLAYPETIAGQLALTWSHRNRLASWSYADSGETATPEPDTHYRVMVYGETGTLIHTEDDLAGTAWTYAEADELDDSGLTRLNYSLRIVIEAVNGDDLASWQAFDHTVSRVAPGWGNDWGGSWGN